MGIDYMAARGDILFSCGLPFFKVAKETEVEPQTSSEKTRHWISTQGLLLNNDSPLHYE